MADRSRKFLGRRAIGLLVLLAAVLVLVLLLAPAVERRRQEHRRIELGEHLLHDGAAVLRGRLAGHPHDLPPEATRCINCHATGTAAGRPATAAFGPSLAAATLTRAMPRRGGPPSRYDAVSFCRLLRQGIDPAWVMVDATMPRYDISDAHCQALWARLARPADS